LIHIPEPDPKLLKALSDAGVLPPSERAPVVRRSSPRKRRQRAVKTHSVRALGVKPADSWAPIVCMILAILGLCLLFHR
jgi:hypothetical protein